MVYCTIAGKPDCKEFVHSVYVATYLENHLPNFRVTKIQKPSGEFEPWLLEMCKTYNWFHYKSPIIWREVSMRGGKPHLIGGIQEFWEHICHIYGIESFLSEEDIQTITNENMKFYEREVFEKEQRDKNTRHIIVTGACNPMVVLLLPELLTVEKLALKCGIKVYLHDFRNEMYIEDSPPCEFLYDVVEDMKDYLDIVVISSLKDYLPICDLIITVDDICRKKSVESTNDWLVRSLYYSYQLSDEINTYAKRNLRIIVANEGPRCFITMALIHSCPRIHGYNIVAISSDVGLRHLNIFAQVGNHPVIEMSAPPVWGFIGFNEYVDVRSVIMRRDMLLPYTRALIRSESSLPLGYVVTELRYAGYLVEDLDVIENIAEERVNKVNEVLGRHPSTSKVRSIVSLLNLWYEDKVHANEIISLAVQSDGSFGIPNGLIFSQPSKYTEGRWMPYGKFPKSDSADEEIKKMIPEVLVILEQFDFILEKQLSQFESKSESESELVDIYTYTSDIRLGEG